MRLPFYQVDAFTDRPFAGNPAAVCPLERWLPDATLLAIAAENNLSETAFFVPRGEDYDLRWFTPAIEVDLCGHATLATAKVVFECLRPSAERVRFHSKSGPLAVCRKGALLELDFPARPPAPAAPGAELAASLRARPAETLRSPTLWLAVFEGEREVRALAPDFARMKTLEGLGVIATAPADGARQGAAVDFVSRFFAPSAGIDEDPVTGSAHCVLVPYWAKRLGKEVLHARQVSARGGELWCEDKGERVAIAGYAVVPVHGPSGMSAGFGWPRSEATHACSR